MTTLTEIAAKVRAAADRLPAANAQPTVVKMVKQDLLILAAALDQHAAQAVKVPEPLAARGPFVVAEISSDGEYGDGGPDCRTGFMAFGIADAQGRVLFDSLNRNYCLTEIHEEIDDDGGLFAWDDKAKRDADAIVAMLNGVPK